MLQIIQATKNSLQNIFTTYNNNISSLEEFNKSLLEETNILWWLLNQYSNDLNISLNQIDKEVIGLIAANELVRLIKYSLPPNSSKALLERYFKLSGFEPTEKLMFSSSINKLNKNWKSKYISYDEFILNFCPIIFSIKKSLETDVPDSWMTVVVKKFNLDKDFKISLIDLSFQFLIENLLLKEYIKFTVE